MTDGPYELPPGWRWVTLGEVAKAVNGYGFPKKFQGSKRLPIPFVKVSDLNKTENEREVTCAENYVDDDILSSLQARAYDPGTVVFPKIGGAIATNKKRKLGVRATFDNNIMGLVPDVSLVDTDYLLYFMNTVDLRKLSQVGPVPSIRQSAVNVIPLPLPPLEEQRRIVARIEELMGKIREARRLREEAKHDADRLMPAALAEVFPRPGANLPAGWCCVRLREVCHLYQPKTITTKDMLSHPGPYPVFGANGIIGNYHKYNHETEEVIVTCRGATCGTVNISQPKSWITGNAMVVRPVVASIRKVFLFWVLRATNLAAATSGSAQPQITRTTLSPTLIPLPPLDEQRRIVAYLDAVQEKAKALQQAQAETDTELRRLEQSILAAAFRGKL
ncbi:MAG TPA: restriction endonuclease subunit S [Acidobacteriota bacterium]|nr:restriction endonuclease subunit S [Acidobacteriota bacterium]